LGTAHALAGEAVQRNTFARMARRTHMIHTMGKLFKLGPAHPVFCREEAATLACAEHICTGPITLLRPRRTASHICSIRGNLAPLTEREREDATTALESAERTPPWNASRSARALARDTEQVIVPHYRSDTPTAHLWAEWRWTAPTSAAPEREFSRRFGKNASDLKLALIGPLGTHRHRCVADGPFLFALLKFCPPLLCPRLQRRPAAPGGWTCPRLHPFSICPNAPFGTCVRRRSSRPRNSAVHGESLVRPLCRARRANRKRPGWMGQPGRGISVRGETRAETQTATIS